MLSWLYVRWQDWGPVLLGPQLDVRGWPGPVWPDRIPRYGPAHALQDALRRIRTTVVFFPVDLPWISPYVLRLLLERCDGDTCAYDGHVFHNTVYFIPVGVLHPQAVPAQPVSRFQTWCTMSRIDRVAVQRTPDDIPWWRDVDTVEDFRFWQTFWIRRGHRLDWPATVRSAA